MWGSLPKKETLTMAFYIGLAKHTRTKTFGKGKT